ncbi:hypothetical protein A2U01_0006272, partial [Trifolium medium]|nr:hypothetical protein [Trifolium medium]
PVALGPSSSPVSAPSSPSGFTPTPSPKASSDLPSPTSSPLAPQQDTNVPLLTPPSTTGSGRSSLTPSSAVASYNVSPSVLLIAMGFVVLKFY